MHCATIRKQLRTLGSLAQVTRPNAPWAEQPRDWRADRPAGAPRRPARPHAGRPAGAN